eukprot:752324-Hanusia_phi.AAC.1
MQWKAQMRHVRSRGRRCWLPFPGDGQSVREGERALDLLLLDNISQPLESAIDSNAASASPGALKMSEIDETSKLHKRRTSRPRALADQSQTAHWVDRERPSDMLWLGCRLDGVAYPEVSTPDTAPAIEFSEQTWLLSHVFKSTSLW